MLYPMIKHVPALDSLVKDPGNPCHPESFYILCASYLGFEEHDQQNSVCTPGGWTCVKLLFPSIPWNSPLFPLHQTGQQTKIQTRFNIARTHPKDPIAMAPCLAFWVEKRWLEVMPLPKTITGKISPQQWDFRTFNGEILLMEGILDHRKDVFRTLYIMGKTTFSILFLNWL